MKTIFFLLTLSVLLTACGNSAYEPTAENCKREHWQTLTDTSKRDALVEACMTQTPGTL